MLKKRQEEEKEEEVGGGKKEPEYGSVEAKENECLLKGKVFRMFRKVNNDHSKNWPGEQWEFNSSGGVRRNTEGLAVRKASCCVARGRNAGSFFRTEL